MKNICLAVLFFLSAHSNAQLTQQATGGDTILLDEFVAPKNGRPGDNSYRVIIQSFDSRKDPTGQLGLCNAGTETILTVYTAITFRNVFSKVIQSCLQSIELVEPAAKPFEIVGDTVVIRWLSYTGYGIRQKQVAATGRLLLLPRRVRFSVQPGIEK